MNYIYFILIIIGSILASKLSKIIFLGHFKKVISKTKTKIDDLIIESFEAPIKHGILLLGVYIAFNYLSMNSIIIKIIRGIFTVLLTMLIASAVIKLINSAIELYWVPKAKSSKTRIDDNIIPLVKTIASWIIWSIAFVFTLNNLGINVTSLIAGLGVGGLAIAFALQNVLQDVFSSISIYLDRPFQIGDFIVIGNDSGTVKKIGIKSTRLETLQGEELVISNKELTDARVANFKRMKKRRVKFKIGVEYNTPLSKLKKIPKIIEKIIKNTENVELNRVHFTEFGDFALIYEIVVFINSKDYMVYKDVQQKINFKILEEFEKEKISMAFPTQTIYLQKLNK